MPKASLLPRAVAPCAALLTGLLVLPPTAAAQRASERTPVDLSAPAQGGTEIGGGSLVRTIAGLAIVIAVIYGVAWVLRQLRQSRLERATGAGLATVASVGLTPGTSLHLVRAGSELLLVGVGSHGVTPVRTYTEQEAREAGLIDEWGELIVPDAALAGSAPANGTAPRLPSPARAVDALRRWTVRR